MYEHQLFPRSERYVDPVSLGEGGMGQVFRAWDRVLNRHVAIKVPTIECLGNEMHHARFLREAALLAEINDSRVVRVFDVVDGDPPYMVQQLLAGETLEARCERKLLSPDEARAVARAFAEGLHVLHRAGIVHRDLKPSNVFLREEGGLCLLDFGLARKLDQTHLTRHGLVVGTSRWMSPEMLGAGEVDHASDVYQVGLILHHALTGRLLDRPDPPSYDDLLALVDGARPDPEPDATLPEDLRSWIRACCRLDPIKRELRPSLAGSVSIPRSTEAARSDEHVLRDGTASMGRSGKGPERDPLQDDGRPHGGGGAKLLRGAACAVLLFVLALATFRLASSPEGTPNRRKSPPPGLNRLVMADALHVRADPSLLPPASRRIECSADGSPPSAFTLEERYGRLEGGIDLPRGWKTLHVGGVLPNGEPWRETVGAGDALPLPTPRARLAEGALWIDWNPLFPEALELYVGLGDAAPSRRGRFEGRARIVLPGLSETDEKTPVRWELRLGSRRLAEGTNRQGLRTVWSPPARLEVEQDEILHAAVRGRRIFMLSSRGRWLSLDMVPETTGPRVRLQRCLDLAEVLPVAPPPVATPEALAPPVSSPPFRLSRPGAFELAGTSDDACLLTCLRPTGYLVVPHEGPPTWRAIPLSVEAGTDMACTWKDGRIQWLHLDGRAGLELVDDTGRERRITRHEAPRWRALVALAWSGSLLYAAGLTDEDRVEILDMSPSLPEPLLVQSFAIGPWAGSRAKIRNVLAFAPRGDGGYLCLAGNAVAFRRDGRTPPEETALRGEDRSCSAGIAEGPDGTLYAGIARSRRSGPLGHAIFMKVLEWKAGAERFEEHAPEIPRFILWEGAFLGVFDAVTIAGRRLVVNYGFRLNHHDANRAFRRLDVAPVMPYRTRTITPLEGRLLIADNTARIHVLDMEGFR